MKNKTLENLVRAYYMDFATQYNIKDFPTLADVFAIITIESGWDEKAESPAGAKGLMQITQPALDTINSIYASNLTLDDMLRADRNIWVGIRYLRWIWRTLSFVENPFLREAYTIMAYNWGIGNVQKWLNGDLPLAQVKNAVPKETKDYLTAFVYYKNKYKEVRI